MQQLVYRFNDSTPRKSHSRFPTTLALAFVAATILPNLILATTEHYPLWSTEALILLPLGFYMMWSVALRRSGIMIWLGFPFLFFGAFQIVLLYLFGNSIVAADMLTNVITTNPGEATELLGNIYPAVLFVAALYLPLLWLAAREIGRKRTLSTTARKTIGLSGAAIFGLGVLALWPAYRTSDHVLRDEVFPINVGYNVYVSGSELRKSLRFGQTTADFDFHARRTVVPAEREIYVYVIGEASRAMNWQLYGYSRPTNPCLKRIDDLILHRNVLTQSNTTHKSVPLFLSSVDTNEHEEIYRRKGLPALFNAAGFETHFISNQSRQGAMIDNLARDARHIRYLGEPRLDMQLLDEMKQAVERSSSRKILFILHCYGSHFSYHCRYPRSYARFVPDPDTAIRPQNSEALRNAYDNSICYTDAFLAATIDYLRSLSETASALLYCADHGEDLFDDSRGRFLHASPTTTAYQLHVASFSWFSERYRQLFPEKAAAAEANASAPATTRFMYHTMADIASIEGRYCDRSASLVSFDYDRRAPRRYLNDHNEAVRFSRTGLEEADYEVFRRAGIAVD